MGLLDPKTKKSSSTNQMWEPVEQGYETLLGSAADYFGGLGRPKLNRLNRDITNSFSQTRRLAGAGVPNLDQMYATQQGLLANGGMTGTMQDSVGYLTNFANGSYQEDPRLKAAIAEREKRAMNGAATQFGGGRYGSAGIGQGMGSAMATAGNDLMLQSNENSRNRQLQAAGQIGQLGTAGAQNMNTVMAMSPMMNELRYDGASRLAGMGDFLQNRQQGRTDQLRNYPQQDMNWYGGILGGLGGQGSTTVTRTPGPSAAQSILGGAAMGAGIGGKIPGIGAGWGAAAGGILGGFL